MNEVYIFDIDGCIMPPIISNFDENAEPREKMVNEAKNIGRKIKLFSTFINYYEKSCKHAKSVFFITGRKYSEFGKLTESHLKPLNKIKRYRVIYFPERKLHDLDVYFEWKIKKVKELINRNGKIQYKDESKPRFFKIFDDMDEHFPKIKELSEIFGVKVKLYSINGENSWESLNN